VQRIVYLSWPVTQITGGIKMTFRHVEGLREAGFAAFVAAADAQPPGWFKTSAPVLKLSELVPQTDVLVFPENHNGLLEQFATWPNPKVVFCQNQYMAIRGLGNRRDYAEFGVQFAICVAQGTATYFRRRFPGLPVFIVPNYVDQRVFQAQPKKRLQIAFMPKKRSFEVFFIRDLFMAENPQWRGIPWAQIQGVSEQEVARVLRESAVYLSLCRFEAFSLSLIEGLACGCITAGFTGIGGRQVTTAANGFWAVEDDCIDCVDQLTLAVRLVTEGGNRLQDMFEAAIATAALYRREKFVASLTRCWKTIASGAQISPPLPG
jgi:hypothetical protein